MGKRARDFSHRTKRSAIPLKWAEGDRCALRRDGEVLVGRIDALEKSYAVVRLNEWRYVYAGIDELELVPLAQATTLPAPPEKDVDELTVH